MLESLRAEPWFNREDFDKALAVARKHYPEPPRKAAPLVETCFATVDCRAAPALSRRNPVPKPPKTGGSKPF